MKIELQADEILVREGAANLQCGIEAVGGKLFLTNQRLVFQSHFINVQTGMTEIALSNIKNTALSWTKFLGFIPLFPNSFIVHTFEDKAFQFVLYGRTEWQTAINMQIKIVAV